MDALHIRRQQQLAPAQLCLFATLLVIVFFSAFLRPSFGQLVPQAQAIDSCENFQCNAEQQGDNEYYDCISQKKSCIEQKLSEVQTQKTSLTNTIAIINGQISIQQLQIDQLQAEIAVLERDITGLSERISGLNLSLDRLSTMLVGRIQAQYKSSQVSPMTLLFGSESFNDFMSQYRYLRQAGQQTALAMARAENQRLEYDEQKALKESKQLQVEKKKSQLESAKLQLSKQRSEQQFFLAQTKNDELKYQSQLAQSLAELAAIQSIIAGNGDESKVRDVKEGESIASIIQGSSPCSSGTHLHFEVVKHGVNFDPTGFLKSIDAVWNNQPDGSFGFGGDWNWPVNDAAKINQGYGMTCYARPGCYYPRGAYGGSPHTGIDIASKSYDYTVKAVKDGVLYRGSIGGCHGGGLLKYVRVEHKDSDINTYYLHVNY